MRPLLLLSVELLLAPLSLAGSDAAVTETNMPTDVFVTPRVGLLREAPRRDAKIVARAPFGTRLELLEEREGFLRVRLPEKEVATGPAPTFPSPPLGFLSTEAASVFPPGPKGSRELVAVGRFLAADPARRPLAATLLIRACDRLRAAGTPDAEAEVLLGKTAEALASGGGPFPAGLAFTRHSGPSGADRWVYDGMAFSEALGLLRASEEADHTLLDRARAGALRAEFPATGTGLIALLREVSAFLDLAETAVEPHVLDDACERAGTASLALGRLLLAAGRCADLATLGHRLEEAADRAENVAPGRGAEPRLRASAQVLAAMRGNGAPAFPQEVVLGIGPEPLTVRIEGDLGALSLAVRPAGPAKTFSTLPGITPILPVPGSLRLAPDGRAAAWLEVSGPSTVAAVVAHLDGTPEAFDLSLVAGGRPGRDRRRPNVVASLLGFSPDGERLALAIRAWDESAPEQSRLAVVSARTGALLVDASGTRGGSARARRALRPRGISPRPAVAGRSPRR